MPTDLKYRMRLKLPSTWVLLNIACALALLVVVVAISRYGVSELIARFEGGTTVVKQQPGPTNLPTIVRPGVGSDRQSDGSKLPTIIRLVPNSPPSAIITPLRPSDIAVIDGDTIGANGKHYRLVGIDTPESGPRAKCAAEREKAARASKRLHEIIAGAASLSLSRVSCNCPTGTEGTDACNYGRLCGVLTSGGRDVGLVLIGEGLAKRYDCNAGHCPPKQSWCS
jgi:endonuclease YncB( thermonuclease family)